MKEMIQASDYAGLIMDSLPRGILLNTQADKFNSMVIGWGHMGVIWGQPTFTVYVRQSRFTREQLDRTQAFTISAPLEGALSREAFQILGSQSGRDLDKEKAAHLTLSEPVQNGVPGIKEYPLTLECRVLYRQDEELKFMTEEVRRKYYSYPGGAEDFHTMYIGEIVSAYIIREA